MEGGQGEKEKERAWAVLVMENLWKNTSKLYLDGKLIKFKIN
jgi:hypothetical protein